MTSEEPENAVPETAEPVASGTRVLTPAAQRALAEAAERRGLAKETAAREAAPKEIGGQRGPDPVRYGDWEKAGIVSDF